MSNPFLVPDFASGTRVSVERVVSALTALTGAVIAVLVTAGAIGADQAAPLEERIADAVTQAGPLVSLGILWWRARGRGE